MARSRRPQPDALRLPILGVDVGGVLVDRVAENSDTSFFGTAPMFTPIVAGSRDAIRTLVPMFEHRVYIVSKAGPKISELTRRWLGQQGFLDSDMLSPANVNFVRRRADKHPICDRLGITHFVDDRVVVLEHLVTVEHRYLFTGGLGSNPPARARSRWHRGRVNLASTRGTSRTRDW